MKLRRQEATGVAAWPSRALVAALLAATLVVSQLGLSPSEAGAKDNGVQAQIDRHMTKFPGGKQLSATEVSYADGAFVISFAPPEFSALGAADCPWNWFCFYERTWYGYPRGKLSSCGWQDLATWGWTDRTESVHNNLPSGSTVAYINHGWDPYHGADWILFYSTTSPRGIPEVPYRNMADHVYRYC